ncbi:MAG: heparinase II/III domain-containing protein [Phycisphaeraceae bacterium]
MIPLNEAEWLIAPFYEANMRGLDWSLAPGSGVDVEVKPQWQAVAVSWARASAEGPVARLTRAVELDLQGADRLCLRASLGEADRLTLRAVVDGRLQTVIDAAAGAGRFAEYEGPVTGRKLSEVTIEIDRVSGSGPGRANLLWLIAVDSGARARRHRLTPVYDPTWPGLLREAEHDPQQETPLEPRLGLFLPEDGVEGLRRRAESSGYRAVWEQVQRDAAACVGSEPERSVREHLSRSGKSEDGRYSHDIGPPVEPDHQISPTGMQACALVGLVRNDPAMARLGLRHALAAMHCTHWEDSFMATRPGALWDHRAFTAMTWLEAVAHTVDWAGALLTHAGLDLLVRTISRQVLPRLDWSLRKYPYMRGNNQGLYFGWTGVLAAATLGRLLPRCDEMMEPYLDVLREATASYFLDDGGADEGPGYHDKACARALDGFAVAARYRDVPVWDLMPDRLRETPRYYRAVASSVRPGGYIAYADGGGPGNQRFQDGAIPRLARLTGDAGVGELMAALTRPEPDGTVSGAMHLLTEGPDVLREPSAEPTASPAFDRLPETGLLCSRRPTPHGLVCVHLIGAKAKAGHGHEDKGSFILDAFGDELLIDRGMCFYGDARTFLLKQAEQHNMLTPDDAEGRPMPQRNPLPEAVLPEGTGDEKTLHAAIDATAGYRDTLALWRRELSSEEPTQLNLRDTVERYEPGTVSLHFHSRLPWTEQAGAWLVEGPHARLTLAPRWTVAAAETSEHLFDGAYRPVYRLTLRSEPGLRFDLHTELRIGPS